MSSWPPAGAAPSPASCQATASTTRASCSPQGQCPPSAANPASSVLGVFAHALLASGQARQLALELASGQAPELAWSGPGARLFQRARNEDPGQVLAVAAAGVDVLRRARF